VKPRTEHDSLMSTNGASTPTRLSSSKCFAVFDDKSGDRTQLTVNGLYVAGRKPDPIIEAACWAHRRRNLYELADLQNAPIAIEAVRRIDELFAIEREINGLTPEQRLEVRRERSKPLVDDLQRWMRQERRKLSSKTALAEAMDYSLKLWAALTRFLNDGRVCLSNNAAERALRGIAIGRRNWTFAGSDSGGRRAAAIYTPIETCKLNDVDPRAWLADVLARLADHPAHRVAELLPWNWKAARLKGRVQSSLSKPHLPCGPHRMLTSLSSWA
jgi:transposase